MSSFESDPKLQEILRRLRKGFNISGAFLFGSRARGDHRKNSDYDLLVIVENSNQPKWDREVSALKLLGEIDSKVDVFVYTRREFEELKNEFGSLPETAMYEGEELSLAF